MDKHTPELATLRAQLARAAAYNHTPSRPRASRASKPMTQTYRRVLAPERAATRPQGGRKPRSSIQRDVQRSVPGPPGPQVPPRRGIDPAHKTRLQDAYLTPVEPAAAGPDARRGGRRHAPPEIPRLFLL